jgi:hypothetical protein
MSGPFAVVKRLDLARFIGAVTVDYAEEDVSVLTALKDLTGGIDLTDASTRLGWKPIRPSCKESMTPSKRNLCLSRTGPAY